MTKTKIRLEFYRAYKTKIDEFIKNIKAKTKIGRIYLILEYERENLSRFMDKNGIFQGGGASDQHTYDCALIERCLEKILAKRKYKDEDFMADTVM